MLITRIYMIPPTCLWKGHKKRIIRFGFFLPFLLFLSFPIISQNNILEKYINEAIATNHGLKEQQFLLEKNTLAFEEAKTLFRPSVGFGVNYTVAAGGRNISFPVGDLLNPVYCHFEPDNDDQFISTNRK